MEALRRLDARAVLPASVSIGRIARVVVCLIVVGCGPANEKKESPLNEFGFFDYGLNIGDEYFPAPLKDTSDAENLEIFNTSFEFILRQLEEENLSHKYMGTDIIRLTYGSAFSFENHYCIKIIRGNDGIYLVEKEGYHHYILDPANRDGLLHFFEYDTIARLYKNVGYALIGDDSLKYVKSEPIDPILYAKKQTLSKEAWDTIAQHLDSGFFELKRQLQSRGLDGYYILLETHFSNGYYAIQRWLPRYPKENAFLQVSEFMLLLGSRPDLTVLYEGYSQEQADSARKARN